jgi:hypothetical protein
MPSAFLCLYRIRRPTIVDNSSLEFSIDANHLTSQEVLEDGDCPEK